MQQINTAMNNEVIMENCENDIVAHMKYSKVHPVYKIGCRGCDIIEYTPHLCAACKRIAQTVDVKELEDSIQKITEEMFPSMLNENVDAESTSSTVTPDDVEMKTIIKRPLEMASEIDDGNKPNKINL